MIETILLQYLSENITVPVYFEIPESDIPEKYVVLERTGAGMNNRVRYVTIAAQSYAPSLYEAAELNERVNEAFEGFGETTAVGSVKFRTDYNFTDQETKRYRYQSVHDIYYV